MSSDSVRILDHGSVRLIESWGSDERIVEAARMSTGKGFLGWGPKHGKRCAGNWMLYLAYPQPEPLQTHEEHCLHDEDCGRPGDEKLLAYLWHNQHTSPFEMAGATFEVLAPIFVFRQWQRHRTQSYNEHSARYSELPSDDYVPTLERVLAEQDVNRQAGGRGLSGTPMQVETWLSLVREHLDNGRQLYEDGLALGVPRELARIVVGVSAYSRMRASANLWNWLRFLRLRLDTHAQWEIRQYASAVGRIIGQLFPRTWALFVGEMKNWEA